MKLTNEFVNYNFFSLELYYKKVLASAASFYPSCINKNTYITLLHYIHTYYYTSSRYEFLASELISIHIKMQNDNDLRV